jgi:hypothetical protein
LRRWHIIPAKSLSVRVPPAFPQRLVPAFVRGYFDGDGSIYWRQRNGHKAITCKFTSGSARLLEDVRWRLNKECIETGAIYRGSGQARVLPIQSAKLNVARFAAYLYKGAEAWLPRKRVVFEELGML